MEIMKLFKNIAVFIFIVIFQTTVYSLTPPPPTRYLEDIGLETDMESLIQYLEHGFPESIVDHEKCIGKNIYEKRLEVQRFLLSSISYNRDEVLDAQPLLNFLSGEIPESINEAIMGTAIEKISPESTWEEVYVNELAVYTGLMSSCAAIFWSLNDEKAGNIIIKYVNDIKPFYLNELLANTKNVRFDYSMVSLCLYAAKLKQDEGKVLLNELVPLVKTTREHFPILQYASYLECENLRNKTTELIMTQQQVTRQRFHDKESHEFDIYYFNELCKISTRMGGKSGIDTMIGLLPYSWNAARRDRIDVDWLKGIGIETTNIHYSMRKDDFLNACKEMESWWVENRKTFRYVSDYQVQLNRFEYNHLRDYLYGCTVFNGISTGDHEAIYWLQDNHVRNRSKLKRIMNDPLETTEIRAQAIKWYYQTNPHRPDKKIEKLLRKIAENDNLDENHILIRTCMELLDDESQNLIAHHFIIKRLNGTNYVIRNINDYKFILENYKEIVTRYPEERKHLYYLFRRNQPIGSSVVFEDILINCDELALDAALEINKNNLQSQLSPKGMQCFQALENDIQHAPKFWRHNKNIKDVKNKALSILDSVNTTGPNDAKTLLDVYLGLGSVIGNVEAEKELAYHRFMECVEEYKKFRQTQPIVPGVVRVMN